MPDERDRTADPFPVNLPGEVVTDDFWLAPRAPTKKPDQRKWDAVREYARRFVTEHSSSARESSEFLGMSSSGRPRFTSRSWETRIQRVSIWELYQAIFCGERVDTRGVHFVRHMTIDIDAHAPCDVVEKAEDEAWRARKVVTLDEAMSRKNGARTAALCRKTTHRAAWPLVQAFRARVPGAVVVMTRRGYHLEIPLAPTVVRVAAHAVARLVEGIEVPEGLKVETFPKMNRDGVTGRTCTLPLTGSGRIVGPDGLKRANRTRLDDIRTLLEAPPVPIADAPVEAPAPKGETEPSPPVARKPLRISQRSGLADDGCGLPQVRNKDADGQYTGAFTQQVLGVLRRIDDDQSWQAVCKIVAGAFYRGIPRLVATRAFDAWLMLDHDATHTSRVVGRRALRKVFVSAWNRYEQGVRDGTVTWGGMRSREVRDRFYELAGMAAVSRAA